MTNIIVIMLIYAIVGGALWFLYMKEETDAPLNRKGTGVMYIAAVLCAGIAVHIICALKYYGHETDMSCFSSWSDAVYKEGFANFYHDGDFRDYTPGYVYVMWVLGAFRKIFAGNDKMLWFILKIPAMLADIIMALLVYKIAGRRFSEKVAAVFALLIAVNPALIVNSASWGQIDSILALLCVLSIYFASERKFPQSFALFAAAALVKAQAFFFTPVIIYSVLEAVWLPDEFSGKEKGSIKQFAQAVITSVDWKKTLVYTAYAAAAVAGMIILFMPFGATPWKGIDTVIKRYIKTMGEYKYKSVNAFNIFAAAGNNWEAMHKSTSMFGSIMIIASVIYSAYVFFRSKSPAKYYLSAFILVFGTYMFSVRMHERYAFPAVFMLMFAFMTAPSLKSFLIYMLMSLSQFFNTAWVLFVYSTDTGKYYRSLSLFEGSILNICMAAFCIYIIQRYYIRPYVIAGSAENGREAKREGYMKKKNKRNIKKSVKNENNGILQKRFRVSEYAPKLTKWDLIIVAAIMIIYGGIAFYNLGNTSAPRSGLSVRDGDILVDLGEEKMISKTRFFLGSRHLQLYRELEFTYMDENGSAVLERSLDDKSVFCWSDDSVNREARYVRISTGTPQDNEPLELNEVCFLDSDGKQIEPVNTDDERVKVLFDEQETMPAGKSYMHGTYFDEIYHARTAYEYINHQSIYETTHPPLGKIFIGWGIFLFGMVPFGWRFMGTLFGVLMIPVIYILAKRILKHTWLALLVCVLFTFDFMHFTQTRIATIDVYVTFFIMLMYYYMYKYYKMSYYDTPLVKTLIPLGLSGLFFGLAVASKWTGLYGGLGLAVIFFYTVYERASEYNTARKRPMGSTDGIEHAYVTKVFRKNLLITLGFCVIMFVIVPAVIYMLSYIPYTREPGKGILETIFKNGQYMYEYHSKLVADSTHPYSSHWYEWPIIYRPLWYFSNTLDNGLKQGISSFGNPVVWWTGIGAIAYVTALAIIIPLRNRKYLGYNKYAFAAIYAMFFAILCLAAYMKGTAVVDTLTPDMVGNDMSEFERLVQTHHNLTSTVQFYSAVMVGVFLLVLAYDDCIKQTSNRTALFLIIGYFAELMPWMLVSRTTYIYHYFPCVPFVVLMIGYSFKTFFDNARHKKTVIAAGFVYAAAAVALFALFYPVLSGAPVKAEFVTEWLKWFRSWQLIG